MAALADPGRGQGAPGREARAPALVHARVVARDVSIPYVQGGDGPPVVLLAPGAAEGPTTHLPIGELARHYRVVAPALERGGHVRTCCDGRMPVAFVRWMRDFLDGLGLERVALVAEEPFGVQALAYALSDPERVQRIALVFGDAHHPAVFAAEARDDLSLAETPVMVLGMGGAHVGVGASSADVIRFLSDAEEPPPEGVTS